MRSCCLEAILSRTISIAARKGRDDQSRLECRDRGRVKLTHRGILIRNGSIGSNSLVLSIDENPKSNIFRFVSMFLSDEGTELEESLGFGNSIRGKFS